jgi:hypothetical protein
MIWQVVLSLKSCDELLVEGLIVRCAHAIIHVEAK